MARDTTNDGITDTLIQRYVTVLMPLSGWGTVSGATKAVYAHLGLPFPQEPYPAAYVYLAGVRHDFTIGSGQRIDLYSVTIRIIGGPASPTYKVNAESAAYQMVTAVTSELLYRPYLQDPTVGQNDAPFRYLDPKAKLTVGDVGRIQAYQYGDQGAYIGIEIPTTVGLTIHVGRVS